VRAQAEGCREKNFASGGPEILLTPNATQTLGLALRELCDNACQHGPFSNGVDGHVSLAWRIDESGEEPVVEMTWQERDGPPVAVNPAEGFGRVVIERLTAAGLNASSKLSFEADGVMWRLVASLKDVAISASGGSRHPNPPEGVA
jgi:two-component sensor histidine kinase